MAGLQVTFAVTELLKCFGFYGMMSKCIWYQASRYM